MSKRAMPPNETPPRWRTPARLLLTVDSDDGAEPVAVTPFAAARPLTTGARVEDLEASLAGAETLTKEVRRAWRRFFRVRRGQGEYGAGARLTSGGKMQEKRIV